MDLLSGIISGLVQALNSLILNLLALLPGSPFREMVDTLGKIDYLGFVNWFIPFDTCVGMLELWSAAVLAYYGFKYAKKGLNFLGLKF